MGPALTEKSTTLNCLFHTKFEKMTEGAAGFFHDSVDVVFATEDSPWGFNIFDVHGKANYDY